MVDDGVVVVILIALGLPTHQNVNKINLKIFTRFGPHCFGILMPLETWFGLGPHGNEQHMERKVKKPLKNYEYIILKL